MCSTRERILSAAASLLAQEESSSLEEISSEAGVSRATIYRHFGSRDGLLEELAKQGVDVAPPDSRDIRERILSAARAVYGRVGLERATIGQIAEEAGVGEATIYRHFGSHDNLVRAFIQWTRNLRPRLLALDAEGDIEEELSRFAVHTIRVVVDNSDVLRLVFSGESTALAQELRRGPERTISLLEQYFSRQIRRGILHDDHSPRDLARSFAFAMMGYGFFAPMLEGEPTAPPEVLGPMVARMFLRGVLRSSED